MRMDKIHIIKRSYKKMSIFNQIRSRIALKRQNEKRKGVASIEFALIAPALFFFLIGITEVSLVMLAEHLLENATYNASRTSKTGFVAENKTQLETVMEQLNIRLDGLAPLLDSTKVVVTYKKYADLSAIGQPGQGEDSLGTAGEIVVYTVTYPWTFFTPMVGNIMGDEYGIMNLSSRIVVRNEPYE